MTGSANDLPSARGRCRARTAQRCCLALGLSAAASGLGSPPAWADLHPSSGDAAALNFAAGQSPVGAPEGALANGVAADSQGMNPWSALLVLFQGISPAPSTPGIAADFAGQPSLLAGLVLVVLDIVKPIQGLLGIDFESDITPLIASDSPPSWLTTGLSVTQTEYDGMPVYVLAPSDASGDYVVAIHGGAYVAEPTLMHWWAYTDLAQQTDATVVVPIYDLAPNGTAATVVPSVAELISAEIATHGASNVSVYGDSAGGGLALAALQLLAGDNQPMPASMVLVSPWLDVTLSNPNIAFVNDPVLNLTELQQDGLLWAGDLSPTDPLVSPLYGSLEGLPPTYVYSGSEDLLAPDVLVLQQEAIAQDAPISFILRNGEIHDWALFPFLDGAQVQEQIHQQLGLTDALPATETPGLWDTLSALVSDILTPFGLAT